MRRPGQLPGAVETAHRQRLVVVDSPAVCKIAWPEMKGWRVFEDRISGNPAESCLQIENLTKRFGGRTVVDRFNLTVGDGEIYSLLGPSGAGKSTVLKAVLGLVQPDTGRITLRGREITCEPVAGRQVGMVFQDYSLFPSMTVRDNVAFPLVAQEIRSPLGLVRWWLAAARRDEIHRRVEEMLQLVRLLPHAGKKPWQLSGGEQQRVAIARAFIADPMLLCLDEPFSALDRNLRQDLQLELKALQRSSGKSMLYVTHDQTEAMSLSDRVGIIRDGRLVQSGRPVDVYRRPATEFVARFLGDCNLFPILATRGPQRIATSDGLVLPTAQPVLARHVALGIRPEDLRLLRPGESGLLTGMVTQAMFVGRHTAVSVRLSANLEVLVTGHHGAFADLIRPGTGVTLSYDIESTFLLDRDMHHTEDWSGPDA